MKRSKMADVVKPEMYTFDTDDVVTLLALASTLGNVMGRVPSLRLNDEQKEMMRRVKYLYARFEEDQGSVLVAAVGENPFSRR